MFKSIWGRPNLPSWLKREGVKDIMSGEWGEGMTGNYQKISVFFKTVWAERGIRIKFIYCPLLLKRGWFERCKILTSFSRGESVN